MFADSSLEWAVRSTDPLQWAMMPEDELRRQNLGMANRKGSGGGDPGSSGGWGGAGSLSNRIGLDQAHRHKPPPTLPEIKALSGEKIEETPAAREIYEPGSGARPSIEPGESSNLRPVEMVGPPKHRREIVPDRPHRSEVVGPDAAGKWVWTKDRVQALKELYGQGHGDKEIARRMTAQEGVEITPDAVTSLRRDFGIRRSETYNKPMDDAKRARFEEMVNAGRKPKEIAEELGLTPASARTLKWGMLKRQKMYRLTPVDHDPFAEPPPELPPPNEMP